MIITISGEPGAGKSTVSKKLVSLLNMKYFCVGKLLRQLSLKRGESLINISKKAERDFSIDNYLDSHLRSLTKKDNYIVDARLGFYFIPNSFKIFLKVNPLIGAKRISNDKRIEEYVAFKQLLAEIKRRKKSEALRYKKYYHIKLDDRKDFDLIVDTSHLCVEDVVSIILQSLIDKGVIHV